MSAKADELLHILLSMDIADQQPVASLKTET